MGTTRRGACASGLVVELRELREQWERSHRREHLQDDDSAGGFFFGRTFSPAGNARARDGELKHGLVLPRALVFFAFPDLLDDEWREHGVSSERGQPTSAKIRLPTQASNGQPWVKCSKGARGLGPVRTFAVRARLVGPDLIP